LSLGFQQEPNVGLPQLAGGSDLGGGYLEGDGWGEKSPDGKMLTISLSPVPGASHEVCVWRISSLVPGGPLHGGLWEGKAQGC
jgi:hypothetical protein